MSKLRGGVIGAGFWAKYQLAGWREFSDQVEIVAISNRTEAKAAALAAEFGIAAVYGDAAAMLDAEQLDFVDIITDVDTHGDFAGLAADRRLPTICQKPMAPSLAKAEALVAYFEARGVPLLIHENWRWQYPLRALKARLDSGVIGPVHRARITYSNSFPVFDNQPFLKELEQFILTDIGSHILDVARFLFGEAQSLYCQTSRVHADIRGEDVATVMMRMGGATVTCEMSYASPVEHDRFPETFVMIEGERGSLELGPDCTLRSTSSAGTLIRRVAPPLYEWADPAYALIHASIVACLGDLIQGLRGGAAETTGADNLRTCELYFRAYDSARRDAVINLGDDR